MKDYILEIMKAGNKGLYLCELPTGYGKTYNAVKAMKAYADTGDHKKKIIYLTTLNKNLPEAELLAAFRGDEAEYQRRVLRIRSNFDEVTEKLENLQILEACKTDSYAKLLCLVQRYHRAAAQKAQDPEYMQNLTERLNEAEKNFRSEISRKLKRSFPNKKARLKAIRMDVAWTWIGELYPAVFTDSHQILLMSISKFMKRNSCLVEPSYEFLKSDMLENAIIFIDEFDATKATIQNEITEKALESNEEYLSLFRQILRGMNPEYYSKSMEEACRAVSNNDPSQNAFDRIKGEAENIAANYRIFLSYKTIEEDVDRSQYFLLKDANYHTLSHNGKEYIRAAINEEENRVDIFLEDKNKFYANKEENPKDNVEVYALLREINRFLYHFRVFLLSWAGKYAEMVNDHRNPEDDEMTVENAVSSILDKFELSYAGRQIITSDMRSISVKHRKKELLPDNSYYQRGIELFELEDHDAHHDATKLRLVAVYDTPEKILSYLAEKASVIGVSATAEIPSVIGNYDLGYLKNRLGDFYHPTPDFMKKQIRSEFSEVWRAYDEGKVKINAEIIKDQNDDICEVCESFFRNAQLAAICAKQIENMVEDPYYAMRYVNIARAMHRFIDADIQSMLYLGMALPQKSNPKMDEDLLQRIFEITTKDSQTLGESTEEGLTNTSYLVFLRGKNFVDEKQTLLERLAAGEKIFIMSSYQTLGAGQNLQYKAPQKEKLVELVPDKGDGDRRHINKDIDAIYLGDVTHLTTNTYSDEELTTSELIDMLIQIEELIENAEIGFSDANKMIRLAFRAYDGDGAFEHNQLYDAESVKLQATRQVMQAIGRLCRTYLKSENIYIFVEEKLLGKISAAELKKHILPPEMQAIVKLRESLGAEYTRDQEKILRRAEKISSFGMWKIRQMLSQDWTEDSMTLWKRLRQLVLQYPTADADDCENDALMRELYITSGEKQNRYFYSQYSDFSDVSIDFGSDPIAFRNSGRAKQKADSSEVVVCEASETESRLPVLMKYPGMQNYFVDNGYAITFEENDYMMSPVLFHNIYKGVLGETAGRLILKRELGIDLSEIEDPDRFEFFDYEMADGVYVDFKNWKFNYLKDRAAVKKDILGKLNQIDGKRVYIINIVGDADAYEATAPIDARVIEIPCLIDEQGRPVRKYIHMIREEDISCF